MYFQWLLPLIEYWSIVLIQYGVNAHMFSICTVYFSGLERLRRNNNVPWTGDLGVCGRLLNNYLDTYDIFSFLDSHR